MPSSGRLVARTAVAIIAAATATTSPSLPAAAAVLEPLGRYAAGGDEPLEAGAEIVAFDRASKRLFVTNGAANAIDILDAADPTRLRKLRSIDIGSFGGTVTSVASNGRGLIAATVPNADGNLAGKVVLLNADGVVRGQATVGALPDSLTFTPNGRTIVVANEGEPTDTGDPKGSISIVDVRRPGAPTVTTLDFTRFDAEQTRLVRRGLRLFPDKVLSDDVEPEYVAISPGGRYAYVTLQEANAIARVDLFRKRITDIFPLGTKDHSVAGAGLDASDEDGRINIRRWPVRGFYMPDAIAAFDIRGRTFSVSANEGDDRGENERVEDLTLDPGAFPDAAVLQAEDALGRLNVSPQDGDRDGDGDQDALLAYGARSFSIVDGKGRIVFDSGDLLERVTARAVPEAFNSDGGRDSFDTRSDNKGPEPEGVAVGRIGRRTLGFIGLERVGGIVVVDLSTPTAPRFLDYVPTVDLDAEPGTLAAGDVAPEGLTFIPGADSPTGAPLLAVTFEISGTTRLFEVGG